MKKTILTLLITCLAAPAYGAVLPARLGANGCPSPITMGQLGTYAIAGNECKVSNAATTTDCINTGTAMACCIYDGSTWVPCGGTGDITGPATSTDDALPVWNGTDGSALQNSECTLSDADGDTILDTLFCLGGFTAGNRNTFSPPQANSGGYNGNQVNLTPDATCATEGFLNLLTFLDIDETSAVDFRICSTTTDLGKIGGSLVMKLGGLATLPTCNAAEADRIIIDTTGPGQCWCSGSAWVLVGGTGPCA